MFIHGCHDSFATLAAYWFEASSGYLHTDGMLGIPDKAI